MLVHANIYAQSITVNIPSTDDYQSHIQPIKPNGFRQILINVTNDSYTNIYYVSIDKSYMGTIIPWVYIEDDNRLVITARETKTFKLNILVPLGASEGIYNMPLNFDVEDADDDIYTFSYSAQVIIVDNSIPSSPTFDVLQTSEEIHLSTIRSNDLFSSIYTLTNHSELGWWGIKEFKIEIKEPNGTIAKTKIFYHNEGYDHSITGLDPNTDYNAVVTAVDYVGFSNSTEKSAKTAPAKPTNLSFSNITYIDAILNWSPSTGATGYNVYSPDNVNTPLNSSPVAGTSFLVDGLEPETSYDYFVRAINSGGLSDKSDNATVNTHELSEIDGDQTICSGISTYTVDDLDSGYTVSWIYNSSRLNLVSASGASAEFSKIWSGASTTIGASITSPNGPVLELEEIDVWLGAPALYAFDVEFTNCDGEQDYLCVGCDDNSFEFYDQGGVYDYFEVKITNTAGTYIYDNSFVIQAMEILMP